MTDEKTPPPPADAPLFQTRQGLLRGVLKGGDVQVFKGVRYAASTAGAGRFKPPQPAPEWSGVRDALAFGPRSPQRGDMSVLGDTVLAEVDSEDCLVLNVWAPAGEAVDVAVPTRPVMVWIHGGGFRAGSGASAPYDGAALARREGVVVVTLNHRLNVFGHLHLEQLCGPAYADSGNAGMLDLVAALQWVRDNIAGVGGDAGNVTIFGESGGGRKVSVLMAMPAARGLFHKAIVQSGAQLRCSTQAVATDSARRILQHLGIAPADAHRLADLPVEDLLDAHDAVSKTIRDQLLPVIGGAALPTHPFDPSAPRDAPQLSADIPLIIGTNRTEHSLFYAADPSVFGIDDTGLRRRVASLVPEDAIDATIAEFRRVHPGASPAQILFHIATVRGYYVDATLLAERKSASGGAPVFMYQMNWPSPAAGGRLGSPHALEIAFVFNNLAAAPKLVGPVTAEAQRLADRMSAAWAAFARTGRPDHAGLPAWQKYDAAQRHTMVFDAEPLLVADPRRDERLFTAPFGTQQ